MNRFSGLAAAFFLIAWFVACGGDTTPNTDIGSDVPGEDMVTPVDVIDDDGQPDLGRDVGGDESVDPDALDVDSADLPDLGDATDDDSLDSDVSDADVADVCVGDLCGVPCPDDGLFCTDEVRNNDGECEVRVKASFCLIGGACYINMQPSDEDVCMACVPEVSQTEFSGAAGMSCEDGSPCTAGDTCDADGVCQPGAGFGCDDDNTCTIDRCDDKLGCINTPRAATCDDHNECTYQDQCNAQTGVCRGTARTCNDGKECTLDYCDPVTGCVNEPQDKACDDFDGCTENDWCDGLGNCVGTGMNCDDGIACTIDSCAAGFCLNDWQYGSCDDGNACTDNDFCNGYHVCAGTPKVSCDDFNPCTTDYCDDAVGCVHEFNSDPCEPSSACEVNGVCTNGACVGTPRNCEEGNLCTIDSCDSKTGCHHVATSGICDDHNACTVNENCSSGVCVPPDGPSGMTDCDDLNECTVDNCDTVIGCIHTPTDGGLCQDLNPCSLTGEGECIGGECVSNVKDCDDNQPCTLDTCDGDGNCIHPPTIGACDDGDACTTGEICQDRECGNGDDVNCNDANVCTIDACNPDFGCVYTPTSGSCNDMDVCTINDLCGAGKCAGTPRVCEDYNVCTDNHCNKDSGCYFDPNSVACNDFNVCTYDDICGAGQCHGVSVFDNPAVKGSTLAYGVDGNMGNGVDVDDDVATCSPKGKCIQGIDNAFSPLHWLFNTEMRDAATDGSYAMLLEYENLKTNGSAFTMKMYYAARIDPVTCDPTVSGCNYGIYADSLQSGCDAVDYFDNATITGTKLRAGGAEYAVPINIIFKDFHAPLMMYRAKVNATVSMENGKIVSGTGAIGGAVVFQHLIDAVNTIPESSFLPRYEKEIVLTYMTMFLKPDIDLDGDGTDEALSVGMRFSIVTGNLIGPLE